MHSRVTASRGPGWSGREHECVFCSASSSVACDGIQRSFQRSERVARARSATTNGTDVAGRSTDPARRQNLGAGSVGELVAAQADVLELLRSDLARFQQRTTRTAGLCRQRAPPTGAVASPRPGPPEAKIRRSAGGDVVSRRRMT